VGNLVPSHVFCYSLHFAILVHAHYCNGTDQRKIHNQVELCRVDHATRYFLEHAGQLHVIPLRRETKVQKNTPAQN
jgi:hypothetical protein